MDREPTPAARGRHRSWPWRRPDGRLRRWPFVLGALVLVLLIVILIFDWNWFKGPVERAVQAKTGREFHIDGDLDVDLGGTTTIRGDGLRFANADWSKQPQMASAQRAEIDLALWPLLRGKVRVPEIRLTQPNLLLETGPDGRPGNWSFGSNDGGTQVVLGRLLVQQGRLKFQDVPGRTDIDVSVDSLTSQRRRGDAAPPIAVAGDGRWRAQCGEHPPRTGRGHDQLQPHRHELHLGVRDQRRGHDQPDRRQHQPDRRFERLHRRHQCERRTTGRERFAGRLAGDDLGRHAGRQRHGGRCHGAVGRHHRTRQFDRHAQRRR